MSSTRNLNFTQSGRVLSPPSIKIIAVINTIANLFFCSINKMVDHISLKVDFSFRGNLRFGKMGKAIFGQKLAKNHGNLQKLNRI